MTDQHMHIYLNPIAVERAEEFERFLTEVVEPTVREKRPDLEGRFRWLKATEPEPGDPGVVTYVFLFEGGGLQEDWNLDNVLPERYGAEEAARLEADWMTTFVPAGRWLAALGERPADESQVGWTFAPVSSRAAR